MAQEIREFTFTIPAGTPIATPVNTPLSMPARVVQQINIRIPPGPRGNMGFQIGSTNVQIIPATPGTWVIRDDDVIEWPLANQIDSGSWEAFGYNTGIYPHTIYISFLVAVPGLGVAVSTPLVDLSTLNRIP